MILRMRRSLRTAKDRGASAVEYGLMIAAIAAVIVGVVFGFGTVVQSALRQTTNCIAQSVSPPSCVGP